MSETEPDGEERDVLAAELALGLLDGEELDRAQARLLEDGDFAAAVARWRGRLAPLLDDVEPMEAPAGAWAGVAARLGPRAANDNTATALQRRLVAWRRMALAAASIAAALVLALFVWPDSTPQPGPQRQAGPPLVAALATPENGLQLVANWDSASGRLIIASAELAGGALDKSHELWIIPAGSQTPRSLGVLPRRDASAVEVDAALATQMRAGATLAVSLEPAGGSPTGLPTGPVIASGVLAAL